MSTTNGTMHWALGLSGPDVVAIAEAVASLEQFAAPPRHLDVDDEQRPVTEGWLERALTSCKRGFFASWDDAHQQFVSYVRGTMVKAGIPDFPRDARRALRLLEAVPFTLASFRTLHLAWVDSPYRYHSTGFGDLHYSHGWGCAFRGAGHDLLVSRRWLDHGPWRRLEGAGDLTLVQFHDLAADAATALRQALPAHERMGISDTGGVLPTGYRYDHPLGGLYVPEERRLRIVVLDRDVSAGEMLEAATARRRQALGPERPIDAVAYVFLDEEEARSHLHELWLHGLECWTVSTGFEVRIDVAHEPSIRPPGWVPSAEGIKPEAKRPAKIASGVVNG
jgi:hypothetical protein